MRGVTQRSLKGLRSKEGIEMVFHILMQIMYPSQLEAPLFCGTSSIQVWFRISNGDWKERLPTDQRRSTCPPTSTLVAKQDEARCHREKGWADDAVHLQHMCSAHNQPGWLAVLHTTGWARFGPYYYIISGLCHGCRSYCVLSVLSWDLQCLPWSVAWRHVRFHWMLHTFMALFNMGSLPLVLLMLLFHTMAPGKAQITLVAAALPGLPI